MDPMESIKATFFLECEELLGDLEAGLMALENGEGDDETVNAIFRAVHSVKGGAGAFGLDDLVRFAHVFETALDRMRSGQIAAAGDAVKLMLRAADVLADLVQTARDGGPGVEQQRSMAIAAELEALSEGRDPAPANADGELAIDTVPDDAGIDGLDFTPQTVSLDLPADLEAAAPAPVGWRIRFRPNTDLYAKANDAAFLLRELEGLGECQVTPDLSGLPAFDDLDPEVSHLAWEIELSGECSEAAIREVFEFAEGDCELEIAQLDHHAGSAALPPGPDPAGPEISLSDANAELMAELPGPVAAPVASDKPAKPQAQPASATAPAQATIRVELDRVDRLIDLVGELVINQAMLAQRASESDLGRSNGVSMALDDLEQLTREIQDSCMAIRAQPVKSVFQRMPRLLREIAAMTGKQVRLVTEGEGTEVDKTVIERLTEPLTHMVRNAVDHGLETPGERKGAGKPEEGTVRLSAVHRSGRIVIEVADDGRGINRERVRQKAVDRGLIDASAALSDEEVDNLIFHPGFSTADQVSDISGRGVGMDVVKRSIQALGGRISISSRPGEGSVFTLSLPLTLAVLDGMVVTCAGETLVAPLTAIVETLKPRPEDLEKFGPQGRLLKVRDTYVPLIDVGVRLGWRTSGTDPAQCVVLLVETESGGRAALLVDAIQGQRQVVIKSLEANYQRVDGVAAATILGDGRVALILDIDAVISSRRAPPPTGQASLAKAS
ncbi:chemotaxis protein CheA [Hyphobacterium sp. SN044]|uniref:chemotaxis protein CheA n=1 Tax=Hyphobacterium sp. SN044 TaxID=2912575 RepID=UPI001F421657|nr:chemotaxis protein CheA [Hyphobacterium sp. SN044]MCF8880097.1 chemotaxis protein CheA [Hyphobacterium sp. SN044]